MTRDFRPGAWQIARVVATWNETNRARSIAFEVDDWPGHLAGQHVDIRLTAADGYTAERSYSIASPPEDPRIVLTVGRLEDGEVSEFLNDELREQDAIEMRGPIGGAFTWSALQAAKPLLLFAGGSGVVPLMAMLRHRRLAGSSIKAQLVYSARSLAEIIYRRELDVMAAHDPNFDLITVLTRIQPADWTGPSKRIDRSFVAQVLSRFDRPVDAYVCGPASFVETVSSLVLELSETGSAIRTERFGPTGP